MPIEHGSAVRRGRPWWRVAFVVFLAATALALPATSAAAPARDIREVQAQVRDLQMSAASATERYNDAQGRLRETQQRLAGIESKVRRERDELAVSMASVNDLARGVYMSGGIDSSLQVLLADDPTDFLAQSAALDMVAQSQAASLRKTRTAQLRLAQSEAQLVDQEAIAKSFRDDMDAAKGEADERLAAAQTVLDSLQEAERQRLAALEAQQREQSIAAAQQAGVSLAHYSYSQFSQVRRISDSELQPGDLVFYFGSGAHHVAMYIGNGKMVSASNPSDGVEIIDYKGPWYGERYSGAGRVVG